MGKPGAKKMDQVVGVCTHTVMVPSPGGPVPTPLPHPFSGIIKSNLSKNVKIMGQPAAKMLSKAKNTPSHIPTPPGTSFAVPPRNEAVLMQGSTSVFINKKPAVRAMDKAITCSEVPTPGNVVAVGTVLIG